MPWVSNWFRFTCTYETQFRSFSQWRDGCLANVVEWNFQTRQSNRALPTRSRTARRVSTPWLVLRCGGYPVGRTSAKYRGRTIAIDQVDRFNRIKGNETLWRGFLPPPLLSQRLSALPFFARPRRKACRMTGTLLSDVYRKPTERKKKNEKFAHGYRGERTPLTG